ncbi:MAG: M64 family metallopeptidase, partial [Candidatus Symbiothrix sp.]|nr:M64 family metallopeptidase [Candidatus Symbiothrix sp.]
GSAWWSTAMADGRDNDMSTYWMMHEFVGHGFASLADEYPGATGSYDFAWQRSGMVSNVSNTGDLTKVPWKRFIGLAGYEEVGAYPVEPGLWKPETHSIMVDDTQGLYYNAQSRWLIYKHIYDCSKFLDNQSGNSTPKPKKYEQGEEAALFEAFLEFDKLYNTK